MTPTVLTVLTSASARASFYVHTIPAEIDHLVAGLHRVREVFRL